MSFADTMRSFLFLCQERVSDLEMELTTKHKLEVKVQTLQEVGSCSFRDDRTVVELTSMSSRRTHVCLLSWQHKNQLLRACVRSGSCGGGSWRNKGLPSPRTEGGWRPRWRP